MDKIRTGIATSKGVADRLKEKSTPLTFGATAESWRDAFTTISGDYEELEPRENEKVTGWQSNNETVLVVFNKEGSIDPGEWSLIIEWKDDIKNYFNSRPASIVIGKMWAIGSKGTSEEISLTIDKNEFETYGLEPGKSECWYTTLNDKQGVLEMLEQAGEVQEIILDDVDIEDYDFEYINTSTSDNYSLNKALCTDPFDDWVGTISITWEDNNNERGIRPESLGCTFHWDTGTSTEEVTINSISDNPIQIESLRSSNQWAVWASEEDGNRHHIGSEINAEDLTRLEALGYVLVDEEIDYSLNGTIWYHDYTFRLTNAIGPSEPNEP